MAQRTLADFLQQLASENPTPGGGGVAALMGALAAALIAMVCRLTIGKRNYAKAEANCRHILERAEQLRTRCLELMAEDERVFAAVMSSYRLPHAGEAEQAARKAEIQRALHEATETPLLCAETCAALIELSREISVIGNRNVISDAGVALLAAYGGLRSAALNVHINLAALEDEEFSSEALERLEQCLLEGEGLEADYQAVRTRLPGA